MVLEEGYIRYIVSSSIRRNVPWIDSVLYHGFTYLAGIIRSSVARCIFLLGKAAGYGDKTCGVIYEHYRSQVCADNG